MVNPSPAFCATGERSGSRASYSTSSSDRRRRHSTHPVCMTMRVFFSSFFVVACPDCSNPAVTACGPGLDTLADAPIVFRWPFLSVVLIGLVSALRASVPTMALREVALFVLLGMLSLSVLALAGANQRIVDVAILAALQGSALVFIVVFWMARIAASQMSQPFEWIHPFISFANVRHFSQFQSYTLPLLVLPLLMSGLSLRWKVGAFLIAVHWWALQFAVGTRAIWFAVAVSAAILLFALRRDAVPYLRLLGCAIAGGGLLYLLLTFSVLKDAPGLSDVARRGFETSNRSELWNTALDMVKESPMLGVGPMHYSFRNFAWAAHPHNSVLQLASEYGLPVATIVVLLFVHLMWKCMQWAKTARSDDDRSINVGLCAALMMGLSDSLVSGNTLMPVSQITLFVLIGWVIGRNIVPPRVVPSRSTKRAELVVATFSIIAAIVVSHGALVYYQYWDARQFFVPAGPSHPRFWEEGHWPKTGPIKSAERSH